ncbi:MAG: peptide-binding protein [Anaerolineae bacterium]|nr:MAG: peptide-binding protein [Anaerolineae bacterium]
MKPDIRWQLLLAVVCIGLVISVIGIEYQGAGICSDLVPAGGGKLIEGIVGLPSHINPLLSDQNPIDEYLVDLIFDGLTRYDENGKLIPALAESWSVSEGGRVYTFQLNENARWQDGQQVTSDDVYFTYNLLKQDAFPASEKMKSIMASASIEILDKFSIRFEIPEPYGPFLEATTIGLLPAHILDDVDPEELVDHQFNKAPIGTGPFMVIPGRDWQQTGILNLAPNPHYWRQGVNLDGLDIRFYSKGEQLANAYSSGEIQAITSIQSPDMDVISTLPGIRIFTSRAPRLTQLIFNLNQEGDLAIQDLQMRQAVVYGLDREVLIDEVLNGLGLPLEGPFLPSNWAYNPGSMTEYAYDPAQSSTLLSTLGWEWVSGNEYRSNSSQQLDFQLLFADNDRMRTIAKDIAAQWADIGVNTILVPTPGGEFTDRLKEGKFDIALVEVEPTSDPDLYDFWSQEAIVRGQNFGGWNNRRASEALESARQLNSPADRKPYYEVFLNIFNEELPALTLFQYVRSYGISSTVEEVDIGQFNSPREIYESFAKWFFFYREVAVACPGEET